MRKLRARLKKDAIDSLKKYTEETGKYPAPWIDIAGLTNKARPGAEKRKPRKKLSKPVDELTYEDRELLNQIREY